MLNSSTRFFKSLSRSAALLLMFLLPLLGWGQTLIANYDFNTLSITGNITPNMVSPASTATSVTSTFTTSETNVAASTGIAATSPPAFVANATGPAVSLNSAGGSIKYFQFALGGSALSTYSSYKLYFQNTASLTGPTTTTISYSTDGTTFINNGTVANPGSLGSGQVIDFSNITALNGASAVYFRFTFSGASGNGTVRVDNFQVQATAASTAPEIDVTQNNGTSIPSGTGSYAFANTGVGATTDVTFTISNSGTADLLLSGTPVVAVAGADASQFSITQQPASTTLTPSGATSATTFLVRFQPTSTGTKTAGISVANNDSNENPYTFALTGTGNNITPTLTATQNMLTFTAAVGQAAMQSYVLTGNNLTANATVAISSNNASVQVSTNGGGTFAATAAATTSATGTLNQTVQVRFTAPATVGSGSATISNTIGSLSAPVAVTTAVQLTSAPGLLLLEDNFNYAAGTLLSANGWAVHNGIAGANADAPNVVAGSLTNANYPTGSLVSNTNRVSSVGTSTDVNKGFTVPSGANMVYYSALLNIPTGGTRSDYFLHLLQRTNATGTNAQNYRAKLFARPGTAANTFKLGISVTSSLTEAPAPSYSTAEYAERQTYLVIVKYLYAPGGNDAVSLFVFDNATAIPTAEPTMPIAFMQQTNNAAFSLPNGIAIRQSTSSSIVELDGIRVATGWGAAVGNPVYTEATAVINAGNYYAVTLNDAAARLTPNGNINVENTLALTNGLINTTAANSLTLYQSATVNGGSNTSFVNGPVLRPLGIIAATPTPLSFTYPVGQGNFYRPITLNLTEHRAASLYTATQTEGNPSRTLATGNGLGTAPLARVSTKRFYTVTSSNTTPGNFTGTITLSFGAEDYVNVPSNTDFVIAKRDATGLFANQWTNLGRSGNTGTDSGAGGPSTVGTLTSASFSDFSDFVLGAQNDLSNTNVLAAINPLPVELTTFSALRQASNTVAVKWATASEKNSARFEVERSYNGREFTVIAITTARGGSSSATVYAILDKTAPAVTLYYRLRQVDLDGTAVHSPVVVLAGTGVAGKALLYPNPTRGSIHFLVEAATPYRVLNQLGQTFLHGTAESGMATIALNALAPGLYFLELQTANGRVMQKFEKE